MSPRNVRRHTHKVLPASLGKLIKDDRPEWIGETALYPQTAKTKLTNNSVLCFVHLNSCYNYTSNFVYIPQSTLENYITGFLEIMLLIITMTRRHFGIRSCFWAQSALLLQPRYSEYSRGKAQESGTWLLLSLPRPSAEQSVYVEAKEHSFTVFYLYCSLPPVCL